MQKVIYLEADEEITSVIERLKNIKESRIALVIPKRANLIQSIVNLKLLKKQIEGLEKEVVIVTPDKLGRNLASQVGFIVYQQLEEKGLEVEPKPEGPPPREKKITYRRLEERPPEPPTFKKFPSIADITYRQEVERPSVLEKEEKPLEVVPRISQPKPSPTKPPVFKKPLELEKKIKEKIQLPSLNKTPFLLGIIFSLAVIFGLCFLILPRAAVTLVLDKESTEKSFKITVDKDVAGANIEKAIIPGKIIDKEKEKIVKNLACTGKKLIGQKATGTVTLSNAYDESPQALVANTRLVSTTNGKTYRLNSAVTIPGARVSGGEVVPGTVNAQVTAEENGEAYNIASSHFTIPGLAGTDKYDKIYADTATPIKGGFTEEVTVLSEGDINANKEKIVKELVQKIKKELIKDYPDKKIFTEGVNPQVLETAPNIPVGTESATFDLKIKINFRTLISEKRDYDYLLFKKLSADLPADKDIVPESIREIETKIIDFNSSGKLVTETKASAYIIEKLDEGQIKRAIAGRNEKEALSYLTHLKGVSAAQVRLWPFWVKSVPRFLSRNIKIGIKLKE